MKYFVALGNNFAPKKFFNRKTQGFTDVNPIAEEGYTFRGAMRLNKSGEPFKIWQRMVENDRNLILWVVSEESAKKDYNIQFAA